MLRARRSASRLVSSSTWRISARALVAQLVLQLRAAGSAWPAPRSARTAARARAAAAASPPSAWPRCARGCARGPRASARARRARRCGRRSSPPWPAAAPPGGPAPRAGRRAPRPPAPASASTERSRGAARRRSAWPSPSRRETPGRGRHPARALRGEHHRRGHRRGHHGRQQDLHPRLLIRLRDGIDARGRPAPRERRQAQGARCRVRAHVASCVSHRFRQVH